LDNHEGVGNGQKAEDAVGNSSLHRRVSTDGPI
jgi:hypothetical protein